MRKHIMFCLLTVSFFVSCSSSRKTTGSSGAEMVNATLDLVNVQNDKVSVSVTTPTFSSATVKGNAKLNYTDGNGYKFTDESKRKLNQAWLKG